jgi:hypothetical protein
MSNAEEPPLPGLDCQNSAQAWTSSGYPIVEGRYLDLSERKVKELEKGEMVMFGPPHVDVYWHNTTGAYTNDPGLLVFRGFRHVFTKGVTEYLVRLGEFLKLTDGKCTIQALSVSKYSVTVVTNTKLSRDEIDDACFKSLLKGDN